MKYLIADDSPLILEGTYYEVREVLGEEAEIYLAKSAKEALKYVEENLSEKPGEGIQIAFLDVDMPGMSGIEAAERIRRISPQTKIIFVTGHTEKEVREMTGGDEVIVLMKPVLKDDLREVFEKNGFPAPQKTVK